MKYIDKERQKAIEIRDKVFRDPGSGLFFGKERDFVLSEPELNLWEGIRKDAIAYFKKKPDSLVVRKGRAYRALTFFAGSMYKSSLSIKTKKRLHRQNFAKHKRFDN